MPIKLPKGLQKRRSSGNALDELPNPPEPSFRVFERPEEGAKSFDGGYNAKRTSHGRPLSAGQFQEDRIFVDGRPNINPNNRGSGGTNNSTSSRGHNDTSSSSARFSSTSTLPSSTDIALDENTYANAQTSYDKPAPPIPESTHSALKAAGRAFSFGRKKAEAASIAPLSSRPGVEHAQSESSRFNRPRAMTESSYASESTATPPKLLEGGLDFDDGFGTMFENYGKRQSKNLEQPPPLGGTTTESPDNLSPAGSKIFTKSYFGERQLTPSPIQFEKSPKAQDSPRSWTSDDSQDGLMNSGTQSVPDGLAYYTRASSGSAGGPGPRSGLTKSRTMPVTEPTSPSGRAKQQRTPPRTGDGLQRSSVHASRKDPLRHSDHLQDEDAKLVMDSLRASQRLNRQSKPLNLYDDETYNPAASLIPNSSYPSSPYTPSDPQKTAQANTRQRSTAQLFDSSDQDFTAASWRQGSTETTPRAKKSVLTPQEERSMFDASPPLPGTSAQIPSVPRAQPPPKPNTQNKIMTPAQFERYRKEQETRRDQYFHKDESDDEDDEYEDDDEVERNKRLARERRKQEAHLSVYRQQMMKVTGEQPSDLPDARPGLERAGASTPNMIIRSETPTFSFDKPTEAGKTSDNEDEDVPLGVLAAHGFPSKTRPPTSASSHVRYKSETYPPPQASTADGARPLPPFAKNLPQDPYYGAGLVNPANREPLSFAQNGPPSVAGSTRPSMPPGGLVGVIVGEERARAARRGSPNSQGNYGSPLPQGMQMGMVPGMPPMMSPGEQAQVQMSEQMTQMMQMQMQWMQQMQQMMASGIQPGMQPGQQPHMMSPQQQQMMMMSNGMLAPPGQPQRPITSPGIAAGSPQAQQRTMSMISPQSAPPWQTQSSSRISQAPSMMSRALRAPSPGYAPSLAPSERSNVGMPTRYRPVSIAPADEHAPRASSRASTFTAGTLQPGTSGRNSRMSTSGDRQSKLSLRPAGSTAPKKVGSDDDDEEGWEEMKQQREKKKSTWRLKKRQDEHTALDIYDYPEQ
ncbi:hypothetical protein ACLMJK_005902 [Lecanora helva]